MIEVTYFIAISLVYLLMSSATISLREKWLEPPKEWWTTERQISHVACSLLWPVYLPIFLTWALGKGKIKIPLPNLKEISKTKNNELFKGVEKPSSILSKMIAQRILQHPDKITRIPFNPYSISSHTIKEKWEHGIIQVVFKVISGYHDMVPVVESVLIGDKGVSLDTRIVANALKRAITLNEERKSAETEARSEHEALDAIEVLLSPVKEEEE